MVYIIVIIIGGLASGTPIDETFVTCLNDLSFRGVSLTAFFYCFLNAIAVSDAVL